MDIINPEHGYITGAFSKEEFKIKSIITFNLSSYIVLSSNKLQVFYYPKSKKLVFVNGFQSVSSGTKVLSLLHSAGYKSVSHFVLVNMQQPKYTATSAFISIIYYSFDINCIFTSCDLV